MDAVAHWRLELQRFLDDSRPRVVRCLVGNLDKACIIEHTRLGQLAQVGRADHDDGQLEIAHRLEVGIVRPFIVGQVGPQRIVPGDVRCPSRYPVARQFLARLAPAVNPQSAYVVRDALVLAECSQELQGTLLDKCNAVCCLI